MSLDTFSFILSIGSLAIGTVIILSVILYSCSLSLRKKFTNIGYFPLLSVIGVLAILSTIFVLIYQLGYALKVCELCWWQRIFMFPIDIIVLVSLYYKTRTNHVIIGILSLFGLFFAGYHYYYHFRGWVLGEMVTLPCNVGGLLPACTDHSGVLQFGFLTIPGMAVIIFLAILWLSYLAHKNNH